MHLTLDILTTKTERFYTITGQQQDGYPRFPLRLSANKFFGVENRQGSPAIAEWWWEVGFQLNGVASGLLGEVGEEGVTKR